MRLYEKYKRYKADKSIGVINPRTLRLFKLEFTDAQMMEISSYDYRQDIIASVMMIACFLFGVVVGAS